MTPERWQEVDRVWQAVLALPERQRAAAVAELCAGDVALQREVESLLASLGQASAAGFGVVPGIEELRLSLIGRQLGPYSVRALLGVGGMGEVYRAHDSTLGREVALKILPEVWLDDTERRMRFDREARLLASLNHPNIAAIYGVQESDDVPGTNRPIRALVLELVEGETLADRLTAAGRGLPLDEVIGIASQVVDALEAAHMRGIVHRDLKPANIKVTPEGQVKVLDFGLARALSGDDARTNVMSSPTVTAHTHAGVLLGTAPYMSPEQARGRPADRRADIWAFGCVLYEMLTGKPAFAGHEIADVLANVLKAEPEWSAVPAGTPPAVRLCLQRCLQKDLRQRFHDIGDVRLALTGAFDLPTVESRPRTATTGLAWAGWAVASVAVSAAIVLLVSRPGGVMDAPEIRLEIATPPSLDPLSIDISPNGRSIVFQATDGDRPRLWIRRLESSESQALPDTDFGLLPFWSPDGRSIGFFGLGELKRIDLDENFVRTLAPAAPNPRGGTWNRDGTIVFGPVGMGPLFSVPSGGGPVTQVTDLLPGQTSHRWPQFLHDGRRFLLTALGTPDVRGLYLGSLDARTVKKVSERESGFSFMPPDRLLLGRNGALLARRLSGDRVEGEPELVAPKLLVSGGFTGLSSLRASTAGHVAYRASGAQTQLVWLDRSGQQNKIIGRADDTQPTISSLSRDGRVVAVQRFVNGNTDVWLVDLERGAERRLSVEPAFDGAPVFSPDGKRIAYMSDGAADVFDTAYERATDGTGDRKLLFEFGVRHNHYPLDWSTDSRFLLYQHETAESQNDLLALPLSGGGRPIEIAATRFIEVDGRFSPDGRWVAYVSNETGRFRVYVRPFPGPGPSRQVSTANGSQPRWRRDGGELFFVEEGRLVAVPATQRGNEIDFGAPRTLFTFPQGWEGQYEPSPDGQRFLIAKRVTEASPISVILNWKPPTR